MKTGQARSRYHKPKTVEELTARNVATIAELDAAAVAERTISDRVVDAITGFCGTMTFVWFHAVWFTVWIAANESHIRHLHFDPFPFPFLTLTVSLEAIFLSTFLLISQNRQSRLAERRNHLDLQINLLSEQESTKILAMLDAISDRLGIEDRDDPEVAVLEEATRPDQLIQQIERIIERGEQDER